MSKVLYNKYRPKRFSEVVNQNHIKITLQNEIESGKIAHAYLFAGPRGIGKTTIARIFAKTVNCQKRQDSEPCASCDNCLTIQEGRSFDVIEIDAASNRGINEIRELREYVKYPPTMGQYKFFIIDEAHMLTIEAFNALLKTLEEPPEHTIFILATTEIHKLPETIISRCQRFDFKKVRTDDISKLLQLIADQEKVKITPSVLENIARHSEGYVRDAVGTLGQILALGEENISEEEAALVLPHSDFGLIRELVSFLVKKDLKGAIDLINRLVNEGIEIENFTNDLLEYFRKLLLIKIMGSVESLSWELDKKFVQVINEQAEALTLENLLKIIDLILAKLPHYKYSKIIQLPLEIFATETVLLLGSKDLDYSPVSHLSKKIFPQSISEDRIILTSEDKEKIDKEIGDKNFSLADLGKMSSRIFAELKIFNHSLVAILRDSRPISLIDGILTLGFQYKFQQEKLNELKNKRSVEEAIEKICGQKIMVKAIIDENYQERPLWQSYSSVANNKEINKLAGEFDGEVVE